MNREDGLRIYGEHWNSAEKSLERKGESTKGTNDPVFLKKVERLASDRMYRKIDHDSHIRNGE